MARCQFPPARPNAKDLAKFGPRFEIEVGPPIVRSRGVVLLPAAAKQKEQRFSSMPALIDTGAARTVLTPAAIERVNLPIAEYTQMTRAGGTDMVSAHVASIQFPRYRLATIEIIQVLCCKLPGDLFQCLIGRDILSRWLFTYDGKEGKWSIEEEDVAAWVEPPESDLT